jgi:hypothetical protein
MKYYSTVAIATAICPIYPSPAPCCPCPGNPRDHPRRNKKMNVKDAETQPQRTNSLYTLPTEPIIIMFPELLLHGFTLLRNLLTCSLDAKATEPVGPKVCKRSLKASQTDVILHRARRDSSRLLSVDLNRLATQVLRRQLSSQWSPLLVPSMPSPQSQRIGSSDTCADFASRDHRPQASFLGIPCK